MDHSRVDIRTSTISCGVLELSRISEETDDAIFAVANHCNHPSRGEPASFFIASDVTDVETSTLRFMCRFAELKLGNFYTSVPELNPKTGNPICVYVLRPDHAALKKFYIEFKIQKLKLKRF